MDEQTYLKQLTSQDWKDIYPKLVHYATWHTRVKGIPRDQAKDLASEAISKTFWGFRGERRWNPEQIDILTYLKGVVRSLANHLVESAEYKRKQSGVYMDEQSHSLIENTEATESTALDDLEKEDLEKFLWDAAGDDDNMKLVLVCLSEGKRGQKIADELDLAINDVYNIMKKIKRATKKYLNDL